MESKETMEAGKRWKGIDGATQGFMSWGRTTSAERSILALRFYMKSIPIASLSVILAVRTIAAGSISLGKTVE